MLNHRGPQSDAEVQNQDVQLKASSGQLRQDYDDQEILWPVWDLRAYRVQGGTLQGRHKRHACARIGLMFKAKDSRLRTHYLLLNTLHIYLVIHQLAAQYHQHQFVLLGEVSKVVKAQIFVQQVNLCFSQLNGANLSKTKRLAAVFKVSLGRFYI